MSRLIQTYSTASRLSAAVFKKVITDVMQDKYRTSHLAPRDYSCFRQRSIIVASIATRCRSPQGQGRTGRFPFETAEIRTGNNTIFIRRYGKGSPLLMVHGFPRTSLMWRHMAPQLANDHTVIASTSAAMAAAVSPPPPRIITLIRSGRWRTNLSR
jgi:hypothetical protein